MPRPLTRAAAPPGTTDLMKIPMSPRRWAGPRVDLPKTVTPSPAGPESYSGISRFRTVFPTVVGSLGGVAVADDDEEAGAEGNWGKVRVQLVTLYVLINNYICLL